jgi:hypothetical protein
MASRKRTIESPQMGLGLSLPASTTSPASVSSVCATPRAEDADVDTGGLGPSPGLSLPPLHSPDIPLSSERVAAADLDLDAFDDYDEDAPRLRLVDPPRPMPSVIVEAVGDAFEVSRLRDGGTTVACVRWTRKELEELIMRAQSALEM